MSTGERLAAIPALAVAIGIWNAMGYPVWMIIVASLAILCLFFPKQAKGIGKFLAHSFKKSRKPKLRVIK